MREGHRHAADHPTFHRRLLLLCLGIAAARAEEMDREQMKGLDEQVQEIKSDVLGIAAELNRLEEKLLYPSGTQVAVFVALAQGDSVRLDAVQVQIDGELVAHYIYSFKELDALRKGGVQRLYVGNVPTGAHLLEVPVGGKLEGGADLQPDRAVRFDKGVGAQAGRPDAGRPRLRARPDRARELVSDGARAAPLLGLAAAARSRPARRGRRARGTSTSARRSSTPTRASTSTRSQRLDTELAQHHGLDEPQLDSLHYHISGAEFSVGDFELNYRMHHRAGRAIQAVLEGDVDELVRNEAAYRLARIHFQKDQLEEALHALERIDGEVPEEIRDDVEFLRANVYLARGRPREAVEVLEQLPDAGELAGVRRLQPRHRAAAGRRPGRSDRAARPRRPDQGARARRPRRSATSRTSCSARCCSRRRTSRAHSRRSTACGSRGRSPTRRCCAPAGPRSRPDGYERALVPWSILAERDPTDVAVQEALLAVPYAYSKLERARARGAAVRPRAGDVRRRDRQGRRFDRQRSAKADS